MPLTADMSIKQPVHLFLTVLKLVNDLTAEVGIGRPERHPAVSINCLRLPLLAKVPVAAVAVRVRCHVY